VNEGVKIPSRGQISPQGARGEGRNDPLEFERCPIHKCTFTVNLHSPELRFVLSAVGTYAYVPQSHQYNHGYYEHTYFLIIMQSFVIVHEG
jgi:hypothetical protein